MNLNKKIEIPVKPHQDGIKTIGSMMSASVALILGSCAPLESLSFQDYNAETQTQNALLNYQPIDEILA